MIFLKNVLCLCDFFAIVAKQLYFVTFFNRSETSLYRLMVGYAFRIAALCYTYHFLRHLYLLFLDYLEIADYVDGCIRCDQGKLVELFVCKELVCNLYDALLAVDLAREVGSDCDLVLYALEVKDVKSLVYVFCRNVVQYGSVFQCAYY